MYLYVYESMSACNLVCVSVFVRLCVCVSMFECIIGLLLFVNVCVCPCLFYWIMCLSVIMCLCACM